jgi:hypothetical protein
MPHRVRAREDDTNALKSVKSLLDEKKERKSEKHTFYGFVKIVLNEIRAVIIGVYRMRNPKRRVGEGDIHWH